MVAFLMGCALMGGSPQQHGLVWRAAKDQSSSSLDFALARDGDEDPWSANQDKWRRRAGANGPGWALLGWSGATQRIATTDVVSGGSWPGCPGLRGIHLRRFEIPRVESWLKKKLAEGQPAGGSDQWCGDSGQQLMGSDINILSDIAGDQSGDRSKTGLTAGKSSGHLPNAFA